MVKKVERFQCEECEREYENGLQAFACCSLPIPVTSPDTDTLKRMAAEHLLDVLQNKVDKKSDHWFYEAVMNTFYGSGVWDWINKRS